MNLLRSFILMVCIACCSPALGAEVPVEKAAADIDALLEAHWKTVGVARNEPAGDEVFLRRIYLDLAGRIPTPAETVAFLESAKADKRPATIDALLAQESYVSHYFNVWADILRYKSNTVNRANVVEAAYAKFIKESLRANKPYDEFARELLSARGYAWDNGAIGYYHRDPEMPLDNMALTSRVFLGTRIECAQCHDHPFDTWKQTDFYHLAAYTFSNQSINEAFGGARAAMRAREQAVDADYHREKAASSDGGKAAAQRKSARLAALDNRGVTGIIKGCVGQLFSPIGLTREPAKVLRLPHDFAEKNGKPFDVMKPATCMGAAAEVAPGQDPAEIFARWVASPENPRFTKVIVNRLWKAMFGVALTEAFDDLHSDTKAMVPAVQEYLEKLMIAQRYDMKAFLRTIAHTRAYQSTVTRDELARGNVYHFQGPLLRRMSAEQIWDSMAVLGNHWPDARDTRREEREERRIQISRMACEAYLAFDGNALLEMALARLAAERELSRRETAIREEMVVAKRSGQTAKLKELAREEGRLSEERGQTLVRDFIMPVLTNLAQKKAGSGAVPVIDPNYKMNTNPRLLPSETWKRMYVAGYGPVPRTPEQVKAEAGAETERRLALAANLGIPEADRAAFATYAEKAQKEWFRASELESPAPLGHFLRTMGQSDRDVIENANASAAIPQALLLMNSEMLTRQGLLSAYSPLMTFIDRAKSPEARLEAAYLAVFSRRPTSAEKSLWSHASAEGRTLEDLLYALLNTKQFLFIQ